jgi:hypothetical protein
MGIPICQICKDPIWSFICPHCLARDISRWLPASIRGAFGRFNSNLLGNFSATIDMDGLRCLRCRKVRLANICPFCYLAEVFDWLHGIKPALAERFFRFVPFRRDLRMGPEVVSWNDGIVPVSHTEPRETDEGTCESCERYSDELTNVDGRWICRDCESIEG